MIRGAIGNLDVAQLVLYAFFAFFAALIWYLRREDRREGYPLESEAAGGFKERGYLLIPSPKVFRLADGGIVKAPTFQPDARPIKAAKVEPWPGAPLTPLGDPMLAEVGPGSYNARPELTAKTMHGEDLISPLRVATNFALPPDGGNPIGFAVVGADHHLVGAIVDVWVDRSESQVRYHEVKLAGAERSVLLPVNFADVQPKRRRVVVKALLAGQFANVPALGAPDRVTMLEEDRIAAYYAAGTLYATTWRTESAL